MNKMTLEKRTQLLDMVDKLPAFPKSVERVVELSCNINSHAKEIVRVIECDPVLTAKILKVINSAFYGLSHKINTVQRAVVHLGLNTVKNLAMSVAAIGMLKNVHKANFNTSDFLLHSLTTAALSRQLAERIGLDQEQCSDSFVAGLLHDFGKVVFAEFLPEQYKAALLRSRQANIPLYLAESETIGMDHIEAGTLLAEKWRLSDTMVNAIRLHHAEPTDRFGACIFAANQISKHLQFGSGGSPVVESFPGSVVDCFGMTLEELIDDLGNLLEVCREAEQLLSS